jgi:hypothetical protein
MAVVQISRIQLRRGKKNTGTGLPQLASGELAWAIDTQELFVGNGSVAEGAPYVGRTKILTEHDSILDLVVTYTYKYDSFLGQSLIDGTVTRTLQSRLDDGVVNARSFGIKSAAEVSSDDNSDQTEAIQAAIDNITEGPDVTIEFDPGEYTFSDTITLPSNVKIAGYGKDQTIFSFVEPEISTVTRNSNIVTIVTKSNHMLETGDFIKIVCTSDTSFDTGNANVSVTVVNPITFSYTSPSSLPNVLTKNADGNIVRKLSIFSTDDDATKIYLGNFTVKSSDNDKTFLNLNNIKQCEFVNVKLLHTSGTAGTVENDRIGINLSGNGMVSYNRFKGIECRSLTYGVFAGSNASFNKFEDFLLEFLHQGFNLGTGAEDGANYNSITNCIFDKITRQGLFVQKGTGNRSRGNTYKDVGSNNSGTVSAFNVIRFVTDGNSSVQDIFERQQFLEPNNPAFNNNPYIAEIGGIAYREKSEPRQITLTSTTTPTMAFKISIGIATGVQVNYVYRSINTNQVRKGTLSVAVDGNQDLAQLTDEYEYIGNPAGEGAVLFTATVQVSSDVKVLRINYINNNVDDSNTFTYTYSVLS